MGLAIDLDVDEFLFTGDADVSRHLAGPKLDDEGLAFAAGSAPAE